MSPTRSVVAALAATAMSLTLAGAASTSAASSQGAAPTQLSASTTGAGSGSAARAVRQRGKLTIKPQIAQPGSARKSPATASSALVARFWPARKGRLVTLQRRSGDRWVTLTSRRQSARGDAEFAAAFKIRGNYQRYRAVARRHNGLAAKATRSKSTDNAWRTPELDTRFSGTTLPTDWSHRQTRYDGLRQCAKSSRKSLRVADGTLRLSVKNDPDRPSRLRPKRKCTTKYGSFDWRITGHVSTQGHRAFKYGFAAARMKFQKRAGQHAAFWMQPSTAARSGSEIDIIEWFGDRPTDSSELANFIHRGGTKDRTCGLISKPRQFGKDWWKRYHVFSVEWTKERYVFRIDGKETCRTSRFVSHTPEYLILSLQANTYELPLLDGNRAAPHSSRRLPQHTKVDWVRYWSP